MISLFLEKKVLKNLNPKFILSGIIFTNLIGCQSLDLKTRDDLKNIKQTPSEERQSFQSSNAKDKEREKDKTQTANEFTPPNPALPIPQFPQAPNIPVMPKIAIILGAGGAKTFAHIGFLQELSKYKIPLHSVGGIEFAAPIAALYAHREMANDVEWQMFKLKDDDVVKKNLLGSLSKNLDVTALKDFISTAFKKSKVEEFKIPFICPSYNLKKNQVFLMNRGGLDQVLSFCMAYPPFYQPYLGNISAVREVTSMANYLRQKGANYILFVNVLQVPGLAKPYISEASTTENILWSEIAGYYNKPIQGIDAVISLDSSEYGIMDFNKRREIMNKGAESAANQLKILTRKLGL
jgi:NTE family protein